MKKHAEQRLALLQGEKVSADDELDEIRDEMTRERANALKEQEVRLAAMLAELQMAKAKEVIAVILCSCRNVVHAMENTIKDNVYLM